MKTITFKTSTFDRCKAVHNGEKWVLFIEQRGKFVKWAESDAIIDSDYIADCLTLFNSAYDKAFDLI